MSFAGDNDRGRKNQAAISFGSAIRLRYGQGTVHRSRAVCTLEGTDPVYSGKPRDHPAVDGRSKSLLTTVHVHALQAVKLKVFECAVACIRARYAVTRGRRPRGVDGLRTTPIAQRALQMRGGTHWAVMVSMA